MRLKYNNEILIGFKPNPNDKIDINSLSLFNFEKHRRSPKIKINGSITVIIFGIKYNDNKKMSITSMLKKFVIVKSLVICSNQATDKKINKINRKYLEICTNKYILIFLMLIFFSNTLSYIKSDTIIL